MFLIFIGIAVIVIGFLHTIRFKFQLFITNKELFMYLFVCNEQYPNNTNDIRG